MPQGHDPFRVAATIHQDPEWELTERPKYQERRVDILAKQREKSALEFEITVAFEGRTYQAHGPSLADALRYMAFQLENARVAGSEYINHKSAQRRFRKCKYCGGDFFFAKMPSGKFMPVDAVQVDFELIENETLLNRDLRPFRVLDDGKEVCVDYRGLRGMVWIPHPEVCGSGPRPSLDYLVQRWENNANLVHGVEEETIQSLQNQYKDLKNID